MASDKSPVVSRDEMLAAIKSIIADKLIACNCCGPCEGTCTWSRFNDIIGRSESQSHATSHSHTLKPAMKYHVIPVMVAVPIINNDEPVDENLAAYAISEALLNAVNDPESLIHDYAICSEEALIRDTPTGAIPEEGEVFRDFRISLDTDA